MPNNRDYKNFIKDGCYHVYNRGTGKMNIFLDREDYLFFLKRFREAIFPSVLPAGVRNAPRRLPDGAFDLFAYCLMPNHYHFMIMQNSEIPVSKVITKVCTSYSKYFNKKYGRVGTLFQDQFKAVPITSPEQAQWVLEYIHLNPQKANLVQDALSYEFSSCQDYAGIRKDSLCNIARARAELGLGLPANGHLKHSA